MMNTQDSQALTTNQNKNMRTSEETTSKEEMISQVAMNELIYAELNSMRVQITRHSDLLVTKDTEIETLKATILSMQAQQLSMQTKQREQADLIADLLNQLTKTRTSAPLPQEPASPEWTQKKSKKDQKELKKQPVAPRQTAQPSTDPVNANPIAPASPAAKSYASAVKKSLPAFIREAVTATPEIQLHSLLKKPPLEKITEVASLVVKIPLCVKARATLPIAQKACELAFQAATGCTPLLISQYHPGTAEIFIASDQMSKAIQALEALTPTGWAILPKATSERDMTRRAHAYLRGYFLPLRLAALEGFSPTEQSIILDRAEKLLDGPRFPPAMEKLWKTNIRYDRNRLTDMSV